MSAPLVKPTILLTGATGFVGTHLYPKLVAQGYRVRCATRSPEKARKKSPEKHWIYLDVNDPASLVRAMRGVDIAYYLIHQMNDESDYDAKEAAAAMAFANAAADAKILRMIYLGGIKPQNNITSRHLRSRLITGAILRSGDVQTIELRASIIIGEGSASWQILRDIAVRLPLIIAPEWLHNRTQPVALSDVLDALVGAINLPLGSSDYFDIPGPETMSFEQCILRTARVIGHRPYVLHVPLISPRLSSVWLKVVTRADFALSRELVEGLRSDILARDNRYWKLIGHSRCIPFDRAVQLALQGRGQEVTPLEKFVQNFSRRSRFRASC